LVEVDRLEGGARHAAGCGEKVHQPRS
jgi:hypothetical protein